MQTVTALAHIKGLIMFMVDISETCGYSVKDQLELYKQCSVLFQDKPICVVFNKIDLVSDFDQDQIQIIK